jgi:hypothetical protein
MYLLIRRVYFNKDGAWTDRILQFHPRRDSFRSVLILFHVLWQSTSEFFAVLGNNARSPMTYVKDMVWLERRYEPARRLFCLVKSSKVQMKDKS